MRRPRLSPLSARAVAGPLALLLAAVVLAAAGGLLVWKGNPPVQAQVISAPEKPTGLSAADGPGGGQASLTWDVATDSNITGYEYSQAAELVKLTASDGSRNDQLGLSVSVDGDTMVVGVYKDDDKGHDSGSARVFVKPSDGKWSDASQVATLTASNGSATDHFGISVSVDGDTVVVGAYWVDNDYGIDSGSAYVFVRPSTGWVNTTQTAILAPTDGSAADEFGWSVSVDGDTVVVGAIQDDCSDGSDCGSVYVYERPATGWKETTETAKLTASDAGWGDRLGWFVSVDGDTVVAGATHDDDTSTNSGAAYVFVKPSTGWVTANETAKLKASDAGAGDAFGSSVSVDGDTVVVGAHQDDDNGSGSGSAYVFVRPATGWASATQTAKLTASDGAASDEFGLSVAVGGDTVVVGAPDNVADSGSAYVFAKPSAGWAAATETAKLTASDGAGSDHFGYSVAVDRDTVAVGASHDDGTVINSGSAYVYQVKPWTPIPGSGATTTSHTVTGLTNYQPYTFWLRVVNAVAASLAAGPVKATPPANGDPAFGAATATLEVVENSDGGTNVGSAFTATDPDGDTLAYSLSGTDAASFALNSSTGQISVGSSASLDYETKDSYTVTVSVHDGKDSDANADTTVDDTIDVTINVTDVDLPLTPGAPTVAPPATNGHTSLEVDWAAPGNTGWPYLTGYNVRYRKLDAGSDWTLRTSRGAVPAATTGITISGLESSTGYEVQISAINDEGESGWSDSGTSTTDAALLDLTAQFSAATYEATEGGAATTITVLISPPANREVVVGIKSSPRAGTTFDAGEFDVVGLIGGATLTINQGDAAKSFTIQAQHDDDGVHDQIDMGIFDLPTQVTAGEPSSAVLTITDDEGGTVTLSAEQPEVGVAISATLADPPGPVTGIRWVWSRSVDGVANWNDIADATSASYTPVAADRDNYLRATATYTDDQGPGQKAWKVTANIVRDVDEQVVSAPARPSGLAATAGLERVTLSWEDPGDSSITGYEYYQAAELAKLTASDGAGGDQFGLSVSVDGDTMVVGASRDDGNSGSAYVFVRPAGEDWSEARQVAKLTASDRAGSDRFGTSVSVDGNTIVVGAYGNDDSGSATGSAYVFVKPSARWRSATETAKLTASDGARNDNFGYSISVDGETVIVGAYGDNANGSGAGSAYVFVRPSAGWATATETAKLTASDGARSDSFGWSVSVGGDTVVVGAYVDDDNGSGSGSAYVFVRSSTGWAAATETAKLTASDGAPSDSFGWSVSVGGDTVVVGADADRDNGSLSGSAYVFVRPSTGWATATETAKLTASDGAVGDQFGASVSAAEDTVVVGAFNEDASGINSGSAYVFVRPATGWATATETVKLAASDGAGGDVFGKAVSVEGDTVVVGSYADDDKGDAAGSAYAFAVGGWTRIGGSGAGTVGHTVGELDGWIEHTFGIRALNGGGLGPASSSVTATPFANREPEFTTATAALEVAENAAAGENIGEPVTAADLDSGDTLVYSLAGVEAASFAIEAATGQISVGSSANLDYETKASYSVTVSVHDGKDSGENADTTEDDSVEVTINVTDVDPPLTPGAPTVAPAAINGHTSLEVAWAAPGITGGPYLTGYNVRYRKSGASSDWTLRTSTGAVPAATTGITISGLESSTGYEVQISAINDEGESSWSDSGTSTTDAALLDLTVQYSAATYEAAEGGAATTITVLISPTADREVVVGIRSSLRAGTTFDAGEFEVVGMTGGAALTINQGDAAKSFTIQAQHDDDGVHDQINFGFLDLPTQVTAGEPSSAVLTVTDDEGGTVTLSAEQPEVGVAISATVADPPGPVTGVTWVWSRSVDGLTNWNDIADATSASYTPVAADRDNYLRATATYTDDQGPGQKAWKVTANIVRDVDEQVVSAPARPSGLAAAADFKRVTLSWEDPGDSSITGYEYYQAAELAKLTASDGAEGDQFGWSVSVGGDTMVVGGYRDDNSGLAYVFVRPAGEDWSEATQVAKLTASDGAAGDEFGWSVSVEGDTVVVGSKGDDDSGSSSGSAYVFVRPSEGWATATETAKLTASDGAADDEFGWSVSVDGDTMVVGAHGDDGSGSNSGSAYVFVKPSTGWVAATETAKLTASDSAANDEFGWSVSADGDTMVVGAPLDGDGTSSGSAYVFVRPSTGWVAATETAKLTASDGAANDEFGWSVSVDGDTMVVGVRLVDGSGSNSGAAYVFVKPSAGWATTTETAKLTASDGAASDRFGTSVSVGGDTIAVGAYADDNFTGSAYLFVKPATGWAATTETLKLAASDGAANDYFGFSVSVDGNTVVAGAPLGDNNGSVSGSAYAFAVSGWMRISGSGTGTVGHTVEELDGLIEHTFGIRALNGGGLGPASRSVTATPFANREPEFATATADRTVEENTAAGENIGGLVVATDPDTGDTLVYSLSGENAGSFAIDTATGQISVGSGANLDYESKSSYTVVVSVRDGMDADTSIDDTIEVTIGVTNVDEQPALTGSSAVSYAENGTAPVASYTAADPEGATVAWTLSGDDRGAFSISDVGVLNFNTSPNYETAADTDTNNAYLVTVEASDGTTDKVTLAVTVTVTNEDEIGAVNLAPGQPVLGMALTATLTDPDGTISAATWAWASSTDGSTGWTDISGATSESYTPVAKDVGKYLRATAAYTDGAGVGKNAQGVSANAVMAVPPVNRDPAFSDVTPTLEVAENTAARKNIGGPVTAADPDSGDTLVYSLSGVDAASFDIDTATGQITVRSGTNLDYESSAKSYRVTVSVSDAKNAEGNADTTVDDTVEVTIGVTNVDEAPGQPAPPAATAEGVVSLAFRWTEPANTGPAIRDYDYRYRVTDTSAWSEVSDTVIASAMVAIGGLANNANYEVQVRANSAEGTGEWSESGVAMTVASGVGGGGGSGGGGGGGRRNRAPELTGSTSIVYSENGSGSVGEYTATDPEGSRIRWSLFGDDAGDFSISEVGELRFLASPDFEEPTDADRGNEYEVTFHASDGRLADTIAVTINVVNVDEPGRVTLLPTTPTTPPPVVGVELTANLSDPDGNVAGVIWQWASSTDRSTGWTDISGATSASYTTVAEDVGKHLRATATYTDGEGPGKSAQAVLENTVDSLPQPEVVPVPDAAPVEPTEEAVITPPKPLPQATLEPEAAPEATPEATLEATPEPIPVPTPEPTQRPAPRPIATPTPWPASGRTPEPRSTPSPGDPILSAPAPTPETAAGPTAATQAPAAIPPPAPPTVAAMPPALTPEPSAGDGVANVGLIVLILALMAAAVTGGGAFLVMRRRRSR